MKKPTEKQILRERAKQGPLFLTEGEPWWRVFGFFDESKALAWKGPVKENEGVDWGCDCMDVCECRTSRRMNAGLAVELFSSDG